MLVLRSHPAEVRALQNRKQRLRIAVCVARLAFRPLWRIGCWWPLLSQQGISTLIHCVAPVSAPHTARCIHRYADQLAWPSCNPTHQHRSRFTATARLRPVTALQVKSGFDVGPGHSRGPGYGTLTEPSAMLPIHYASVPRSQLSALCFMREFQTPFGLRRKKSWCCQ